MHACMIVATSMNVPMTPIMFCYILKAIEIKLTAPETGYDLRRMVILTGAYFLVPGA